MTPEAHFSNIPLGRYFLNEVHEVFPMLQWEHLAGSNGFVMWGALTSTFGVLVSHTENASTAVLASHPAGMTVGPHLDLTLCSKKEAHEWVWEVMYAQVLLDMRSLQKAIASEPFSPPFYVKTHGFYHHSHKDPVHRVNQTNALTGDLFGGVYLFGADSDQLALTIMEQKIKAPSTTQQNLKTLVIATPTQTATYAAMLDPALHPHVEILGCENVGFFKQIEKWLGLVTAPNTYSLIVILHPTITQGSGPAQLSIQFNLPVLAAGDLPGMTPITDPLPLLSHYVIRAASEVLVIERSGGAIQCFKSRTSDRQGKRFLLA